LKDFDHKHIIRLYDVFEEPQHYYMITEKMTGGELFDRIVQKSYYNEREARDTCEILLQAIHYCHEKKVAHRDLKPENLLLTSDSDDSDIKLADFGFAKRVKGPKTLTTQCGTVSEEKSSIDKFIKRVCSRFYDVFFCLVCFLVYVHSIYNNILLPHFVNCVSENDNHHKMKTTIIDHETN
jgi:serine/threonine protein kinase